jgi:predicted alpha/beta superfamily hydrolase
LLLLLAVACVAPTKKLPGDVVVYYPFANDSFLVRITNLAIHAKPGDTVRFVYYADQSLKSGKVMGAMIEKYKHQLAQRNYVFTGIAHFGKFRPKRRRDFILPSVKTGTGFKGSDEDYGQSDSFYHFVTHKIIPLTESNFDSCIAVRSWIGHSLGGLFTFYILLNDDSVFTDLYALSPALWIDDYHALDYESLQQERLRNISKNIRISCGGNEILNKITTGVNRVKDSLDKRNYPGIRYTVKIYKGENHFSSLEPTLVDIFNGFTE